MHEILFKFESSKFASKMTDRVSSYLCFFQTERNYNGIIVETVGKIFSFFFTIADELFIN